MTQCAATAQFLKLNILLGATGLLLQNASFNENRNVDRNINMLKDNIHRFKTLLFFVVCTFDRCKVTISLSLLSRIIFPFSPDNSTSSSAKPLITRELFWQPLTTPLKSPKCESSQVSLLSSHCLLLIRTQFQMLPSNDGVSIVGSDRSTL